VNHGLRRNRSLRLREEAEIAVFSEDQLEELQGIFISIEDRGQALIKRLLLHGFRADAASEYATHGLARRISAITYSTARVFEEMPPEMEGIPSSEQRSETTAHLQAVAFNVYGCFDNLARIWVAEHDVRKANGNELSRREIGLVAKCKSVRASLPNILKEQIVALDPWFSHLEDFRHATAHRVPLYIPPFMLDPKDEEEYRKLDRDAGEVLKRREFEEYHRLTAERDALRHFRPMIATSMNEIANALFHPQLMADFATVELWVGLILDHIPNFDGE